MGLRTVRRMIAIFVIPLFVLTTLLVFADRQGLWEPDGPLASTGLLDADGLLVRLRIAGDDRLIWQLPFVGRPDASTGGSDLGDDQEATLGLLDWPNVTPTSHGGPEDAVIVVSPFTGDSALFEVHPDQGPALVFRGEHDANGGPARLTAIEVMSGSTRVTYLLGDGLVTWVEFRDAETGQSGALGFEYRPTSVLISAYDSVAAAAPGGGPTPIDQVSLDLADHPELEGLLEGLRAARSGITSGTMWPIGGTAPLTGSAGPAQAQTSVEVTTTVMDATGRRVNDVDLEWSLQIPSIQIGSLTEYVTGGSLDRVVSTTRTGRMERIADGLYTAQVPLATGQTPGEQRAACENAVGAYQNAGLSLRAASTTISLAGTVITATGGTPPGWLGAAALIVGGVSGLLYSPLDAAADIVRGAPRCAVLSSLAVEAFNADWTIRSQVRASTRNWQGGGVHPDVGWDTTPRSLGSANDLRSALVEPIVETIVLPTWLTSVAVAGREMHAEVGETVTVRVHSTGGTPELRCRGDFTAPVGTFLGVTCSGLDPHVTEVRYRFTAPGSYLVAPEIVDAVGARQRVPVTIKVGTAPSSDTPATPSSETYRAEGQVDITTALREGLTRGLDLALLAVPPEMAPAVREGWSELVEQVMAGLTVRANRITLEFDSAGGPVSGSLEWGYEFSVPTPPGGAACSISGLTRGPMTGQFDAALGTFSGTVEADGAVSVSGCQGMVPPIPPPASSRLTWTATLVGDVLTGEITDPDAGELGTTTPFSAKVMTSD